MNETETRQPADDSPEMKDLFSLEVLEFPAVMEVLRGHLSGPIAAPIVAALKPHSNVTALRREFQLVTEAIQFLSSGSRLSCSALEDPRAILAKLTIEGNVLEPLEILTLLGIARTAQSVHGFFAERSCPRLDELARGMPDFSGLVKELDGKILPDGSIDSSASKELARIRRSIERLRGEVQSTLEKLVRELGRDEVLQDSVVSLRNDRFVIPVRAEAKRKVNGVVHGASSSGATVFVEPLETVPMNNELVVLQDREFAEIQKILAEFSALLRTRAPELAAATEDLSIIDWTFAKAEFSRAYDCSIPFFYEEPFLLLRGVRHPLLEKSLRAHGKHSVPWTLELGPPKTLMIISGPNTGGKTVTLKTIGLASLMAQAGLPVMAEEARVPVFRRILADIGDQQSIQANLSTFSAHISNIQSMVEVAGREDLVLLDEIGASTEPSEGAALAVAVLEHFRQRGTMTFVTTHHSRLKAYAAETPEAVNAAMEFDDATLRPTYRLLVGLPGKSSGLDTAGRLGLDPSIVERARSLLAPSEAEAAALVSSLHERKNAYDREIEILRREKERLNAERAGLALEFKREREDKFRELDARLEEVLRAQDRKWEKVVEDIRAQVQAKSLASSIERKVERKTLALQSDAREEWNAQALESLGGSSVEEKRANEAPPTVGGRVRVRNFSSVGTITAILNDGQVEVEVGRVRMKVRQDEIRSVFQESVARHGPGAILAAQEKKAEEIGGSSSGQGAREINVIGTTAEEACERVDKFLDEAYVSRSYRLRVIHGFGKGILKRKLHEMFAAHPHVDKFYPAPGNEGGGGATIVELKT